MRFTDVTQSEVIFRRMKSYIRYRTKCSGDNAFVTPMADTHNITRQYVLIPQALKYISVIYAMVNFQAVIFKTHIYHHFTSVFIVFSAYQIYIQHYIDYSCILT